MSSSKKQGVVKAVIFVVVLCMDLCTCVSTTPICAYGHTDRRLMSLANLFDRVIQHSARMHTLSSDLLSEIEKYFLPGRNHIGSMYRKCHTSSILTPNGKEIARKLEHEALTEVILKLLIAWKYPLSLLHESMSHQQDLNSFISSKALEMYNIALALQKGVEKVIEKMQLLGMISNSMNDFNSPMSESELLFCFRRDADKLYLLQLSCQRPWQSRSIVQMSFLLLEVIAAD